MLAVTVAGAAGEGLAGWRSGSGAVISAVVPVTPGSTLRVRVGCQACGGEGGIARTNSGSYGGGLSAIDGVIIAGGGGGAGGVGVTGIGAGTGSGGDAGVAATGFNGTAGASGHEPTTTGCPADGGGGGTQSAGGAGGGGTCGTAGWNGDQGGRGGSQQIPPPDVSGGGGGGGGYFWGGGGGGYSGPNGGGGGGGGGSSWVAPAVTITASAATNRGGGFVTIAPLAPGVLPQATGSESPSQFCKQQTGSVRIIDNDANGVHSLLYVMQRSPQEVDVCVRADLNGDGAGGMFAITATQPDVSVSGIGVPTVTVPTVGIPTEDSNGAFCTTPPSGSPTNQVPTSHPIESGGIGPEDVLFDAYSDGSSTAWVCLQVGNVVNARVVIPIAPPSLGALPTITSPGVNVSPGTNVTFYPDPGTP